ncbi:MAG: ctaD [Thermoleophilia bacterium]|nr:ctaD [Thermoleophilia bacterium]
MRNGSINVRPLSALVGLVAGWVVAAVILSAFRLWSGGLDWNNSGADWKAVLGLGGGHLFVSALGALLGLLVAIAGVAAFRAHGFLRGLAGIAVGFAVGAAITMLIRMAFGLQAYSEGPVVVIGIISAYFAYIGGLGGWYSWLWYARGAATEVDDHANHGSRGDWKRFFIFNTDHKVIGLQYLVVVFFFMMIGGAFAESIRAELANPDLQFFKDGGQFNEALSLHGVIMLFLFIIPVFSGIANYIVPIMLGAIDMAYPKLNALSFWTFLFGGIVFLASIPVGPIQAGWTNYATLSSTNGPTEVQIGQILWLIGIQLIGASSIMTAINFIVTIVAMRAPGMTMWRMPLFVWGNLTQALLIVFGTPFVAGSQFMVLFDLVMGTRFFQASLGGDPISYQHIFWFYSHPAVYIMILPGFGLISDVITTHARKPIFGYRALAISTIGIGFLGFTVWAHHMFTSGMADWLRLPMMIMTMLIAVPTGIKVLGWAATLWGAKLHLTVPMMFALGFLFTFTCGGLTGIMLAAVPFDIHVQDTYFVVAHFHYVLFGGSVLTVFAGIYHWFPKMTGRMFDPKLGKLHFWLTFVGLNVTFFPMHWLGTLGMPRRVADYSQLADRYPSVHGWNIVITLGALIQGVAFVVFMYNMAISWRRGPIAGPNPWRSRTLEWLVSSPPPLFNFHGVPKVVGAPYDYGRPGAVHALLPGMPGYEEALPGAVPTEVHAH